MGGAPDFKWWGWSKDFVGFEIFDSRIFLGRKIWEVFSCVFGIQNNLKIPGSKARRFGMGFFWGLIFGPGIILEAQEICLGFDLFY